MRRHKLALALFALITFGAVVRSGFSYRFYPLYYIVQSISPWLYFYAFVALTAWNLHRRDWRAAAIMALLAPSSMVIHRAFTLGWPKEGKADLKVMTYNVDLFHGGWDALADAIKDANADVVCIQEARPFADQPPQPEFLKRLPGYSSVVDGQMLTLSRLPIVRHTTIPLPPMDNRPLQATTVKVDGEEVTIINLHLLFTTYYSYVEGKFDPIHQFPRVARWKRGQGAILAELKNLPGKVIVAGDFNDHDSGPDFAGFSQAFDDTNAQTSFGPGTTQGVPFLRVRIDHIFSKELRPLRSWVVDIPRLSDHAPVITEFALSRG